MNKAIILGITLSSALTLTGCASTKNNHSSRSASEPSSSQQVKVHKSGEKQLSSSNNSLTTSTKENSQNAQTNSGSDNADSSMQLAANLSTNEWYVLTYINDWNQDTNIKSAKDANFGPYFTLETGNGQQWLSQGTADSGCELISVNANSVTIAPSSGEGASSTFTNETHSKKSLADQWIHSQADVDAIEKWTTGAENQGIEDTKDESDLNSDSTFSSSNQSQDDDDNNQQDSNSDGNNSDSNDDSSDNQEDSDSSNEQNNNSVDTNNDDQDDN